MCLEPLFFANRGSYCNFNSRFRDPNPDDDDAKEMRGYSNCMEQNLLWVKNAGKLSGCSQFLMKYWLTCKSIRKQGMLAVCARVVQLWLGPCACLPCALGPTSQGRC